MGKISNIVTSVAALGCLAATGYIAYKNKRTMLDVIIEEIETMR